MTTRRELLRGAIATGLSVAMLRPVASIAETAAGSVQTVLGPLDVSELGFTLPHEHVADGPYFFERWPKTWGGRKEFADKAVDSLKALRDAGISTIVDLTPYDCWRDIRFLEEASRRSGIHMIASTGERFFPPKTDVAMPSRTIEGLTEFFVEEIENGIDDTGIRAGVIKIGIEAGHPTALEEIGLRAAARASRKTGAPIRVHTAAALRAGESDASILEDEGVKPARVSFDHSDDSGDMDYFLGLVKRGYSLSMDHVHRGNIPKFKPDFARRTECIKGLCDAGFASQIFLSQDTGFGASLLPEEKRDWRDKLDPPDGMLFVPRKLIPRLKAMGVSDRQVHQMTVENPKHFFAKAQAA